MDLIIGLAYCMPLVLFLVSRRAAKYITPARLAVANFFATYAVIVLGVYMYEIYLEIKLASFDLDGDEIFSEKERTPEQQGYMRLVTWDTGRTFAPITGLIFAFLYSVLYFCVLKGYEALRRDCRGSKKKT